MRQSPTNSMLGAKNAQIWLPSNLQTRNDKTSLLCSGSIIGILGTGQLGRMLSLAGAQLGFKTHIYGPEENALPLKSHGEQQPLIIEMKQLTHFAESVDVVTYEFENVPQETANFLSQFVPSAHRFTPWTSLRIA